MAFINKLIYSLPVYMLGGILVWATALFYNKDTNTAPTAPLKEVSYTYITPKPLDSHVRLYMASKGHLLCKSKDCVTLAEAGYHEARGESDRGVLAVMHTVLNRASHKGPRWRNTIREVVYQRCEFSYTCDGSLKRGIKDTKQWKRMLSLAYQVKRGYTSFYIDSTHYHTKAVKPVWATKFTKVSVIGNHIFYRCDRDC